MPPPLTKGVLIVEKAEFLNNVVHYQVYVNRWLTSNVFLVGLAKLADHIDGKALIRIKLQHTFDYTSQLG